jgi:hypothetical protein
MNRNLEIQVDGCVARRADELNRMPKE